MVVVSFLYLYICVCVCILLKTNRHQLRSSYSRVFHLHLVSPPVAAWSVADLWPPGDDSLPRGRWLHWLRCVVCCRAEHLQRGSLSAYLSPLCLCTQHLSALLSLRVCLSLKRLGAIEELECWFLTTNALNVWGLCEIKKKHKHFYTVREGFQRVVWVCGSKASRAWIEFDVQDLRSLV